MEKFSDMVRAFPFPVLEEGNLSFPDGEYIPDIIFEDDYSATIIHKVQTAPLIERFVKEEMAKCCCTVSVPKTGYRKLFQESGFSQKIKWDSNWVGEPPILRPFIVCAVETEHTLQAEDGVHSLWVDRTVKFKKGAKIAIGPDFRPRSSMESLLSIDRDESLKPGQVLINPVTEQGFYFSVKVASDLYEFLRNPGEGNLKKHSHSILIHAVSTCMSILANEYSSEGSDESWQSYSNLLVLAEEMERKKLTLWYEDNFHPEEAATLLYPHPVPNPSSE